MNTSRSSPCPLCAPRDETLLWQDEQLRVILADEPDYPALCRVIWHAHVKEMSDLDPAQRLHLMQTVLTVEQTLRTHLNPDKINLASLGNVVPHLHWHIVPRFADDRHFPNPIWGAPLRDTGIARIAPIPAAGLRDSLRQALKRA